MIDITEKAVELIKETVTADHTAQGYIIRLTAMPGSCSGPKYDIRFDLASDSDLKVGPEGAQIHVTGSSVSLLEGARIDAVVSEQGPAFKIKLPAAAKSDCSSCGCSCG